MRPIAGVAIAAMLVAIGLPLTATSASAAVITPGASITVAPNRDFVFGSGYAPGSTHTVNVLRGTSTVGTSQAVTNPAGVIEVNHPALTGTTNCWTAVTPDIRANDVIQILTGATVDSTVVAGITITQKATFAGTTVTIKGTAAGATPGTRIPIAELEVRAVARQTQFTNSKTSWRVNSSGTGDPGTLTYDFPLDPAATAWTATFSGMNLTNTDPATNPLGITNGAMAQGSETRALWILMVPTELTQAEMGPDPGSIVGGPAAPCTAPLAQGPSKPIMTALTDTGASTTDGITKNASPTFGGSLGMLTATRVDLFVDGVLTPSTNVITGATYQITPSAPLTAAVHVITVRETGPGPLGTLIDTMGDVSSSATIDLTAPTMTLTGPANNATGAAMAGSVTATFSEAMDLNSANGTTFTVKNAATSAVAAGSRTFGLTNKVIRLNLNPASPLAPNTRYTAALTTGITDVAGNPLGAAQSWSFTTATSVVASYVNRVYSDLFNRAPDPSGLASWTAALNMGTPRVAVANSITNSTEYRSTLITGAYFKYLGGRTPDAAGLNFWLAAMNSGVTVSRIEGGFAASDEYYALAGGDDASWVNKLYTDVLGRTSSAADRTFWTGRLATGATRGQVAMGFLLSPERLGTVVDGYYVKLLGRSLDPSGRATWVKILQAGGRNEAIIGSIISSAEYYSHN